MSELIYAHLNEKHQRMELEKELKFIEKQFKEKNDENLNMNRKIEREALIIEHKREKLANQRALTGRNLEEMDKRILNLQDELEAISDRVKLNPEVTFLEKENKDLSIRIQRSEKEAFTAEMRVKEMMDILKDRSRERELEADQKRTLIARISEVKSRIDEENKVNEIVIQQKVKEKEDKEMREIKKKIDDVKKE